MALQLITPVLIISVLLYAAFKRVDVFSGMIGGAKDGLMTLTRIIPALVPLLAAIGMLRASGALDAFSDFCAPAFRLIGIPPECAPLIIIRPFSGSGALAMGIEIMASHGVNSYVGRVAAVMLGSTETTFYAISVICGAAGISKTRYIIPASLLADFTGYLVAAWSVKLLI